jgi:hypothetical protein
MARFGKQCTLCKHPLREKIETLRCSGGVSLDALAKQFSISRDVLWRHMRTCVSAERKVSYRLSYLAGKETIAALRERAQAEGGSVLDYLLMLRTILMGQITASAEAKSAYTLSTLSGRLVECLKEIGKLTGEIERLNPQIAIQNNIAIMAEPKMVELQAGLLALARAHGPAVRSDVIELLRRLDAAPARDLTGSLQGPEATSIPLGARKAVGGLPRPSGAALGSPPTIIEASAT